MSRVALVSPRASLRAMLVAVAGAGTVEVDVTNVAEPTGGAAYELLRRAGGPQRDDRPQPGVPGTPGEASPPRALLAPLAPDVDELAAAGRRDLLAGEAELERYAAAATVEGDVAALVGWAPASSLPDLQTRLARTGAAAVPLPSPRGAQPPTLLRRTGMAASFEPLVESYATVPYRDLDAAWLAAAAYVVMFGMMFGDVGHGVGVLAVAAALWAGWPRRLRRFRKAWRFVAAAGAASVLFGFLYGECFGPTGLVPVVWLEPLEEPLPLLAAAVGVGAVLLAGAYAVGTVNRWREGGPRYALFAASGIAGSALFAGVGLAAAGWYAGHAWLLVLGGVVAGGGLLLAFLGLLADAGGGVSGVLQSAVEVVDLVIRLGSNLVSFTRLAAFGLTHAALSMIVWDGTAASWRRGGIFMVLAVVVFGVGTLLAFTLEVLVAGVQALRLEYYELFSRIFVAEGRPFRPWRVPVAATEGERS
jgi:V/A-type H+-transporting ATPase subunit I